MKLKVYLCLKCGGLVDYNGTRRNLDPPIYHWNTHHPLDNTNVITSNYAIVDYEWKMQ